MLILKWLRPPSWIQAHGMTQWWACGPQSWGARSAWRLGDWWAAEQEWGQQWLPWDTGTEDLVEVRTSQPPYSCCTRGAGTVKEGSGQLTGESPVDGTGWGRACWLVGNWDLLGSSVGAVRDAWSYEYL